MGTPLDPRQLAAVNWGKSYAPARGSVEFVRVQLNPLVGSRDFTIYLGDISQLEGIWSDRPYEVTFANGGTSSVQLVTSSILGTAIHVAASEVVVRGDTSPGEDIPARSAFRYQAHCALGTPREHTITGYNIGSGWAAGGQSLNAPGVQMIPLSAFATHAWLDGLSGDLSNFEVTQVNRQYGIDTVAVDAVPGSEYAVPRALALNTNYLRLDVALAPATPITYCITQRIVR